MSAITNTPASASLKRSHGFSSDDDGMTSNLSHSLFKRLHELSSDEDAVQQRYFYVLAPESSECSSEGTESVYSVQAKSTDLAHDTSDTSSKGSWSSDDGTHMFPIELEVVSLSDSDRPFPFADSSTSTPEDVLRIPWPTSETVGRSSLQSAEGSDDDSLSVNRLKSRGLFSFCSNCKRPNSDPHFMLCVMCYRLRRSFLPERPKRRKTRAKKEETSTTNASTADDAMDSGVHSQSSTATLSLNDSLVPLDDNPGPSSQPLLVNVQRGLCQICFVRPQDGGFCHDRITHVYSCYTCSSKTFKQRGRCPVCNQRIKHVSRLIVV
ncbi:THY [Nesidiocoris tenuis]|uniref:THY n=1 Tax=Nesidiocoris tenuis TaxID=355587 RepID=A0ABN7BCR6_9HEMI|nr:THY [Nesidiocoris tenuis]